MTLIDGRDKETPPRAQIARRVDWLMGAGFDFLASESGFSEFTHGNCSLMLAWMNDAAAYLREAHNNASFFIKVHVSSDQFCADIPDPRTGQPLNFNFLPMEANKDVGVYPHTVQLASIDGDPVWGAYGQQNFTFMLDWLVWVSKHQPGRDVVFKPETAYWPVA